MGQLSRSRRAERARSAAIVDGNNSSVRSNESGEMSAARCWPQSYCCGGGSSISDIRYQRTIILPLMAADSGRPQAQPHNTISPRRQAASSAANLISTLPPAQGAGNFQYLTPNSGGGERPGAGVKSGSGASRPARRRRSSLVPWASGHSSPTNGNNLKHQQALLMLPINELRVSGSKSEPPSRPSVDWSKQRPYFGSDFQKNVSVELGKTAYLTCKVFELGDKTVSWLRPRENEILTAGRYTYIGDPRFASINEPGSSEWILEIKDVTLNDSTSYECQVSTDPKMSAIINLHVKAARARIRQGEQYYASVGANIEFTCDVMSSGGGRQAAAMSATAAAESTLDSGKSQTYWYHNGNLVNYAKTSTELLLRNLDIEWDPQTQTSRLKLTGISASDSGNYTCKPSSAEPATIRLHVKRSKNSSRDRVHYSGGSSSYHVANTKEAQRNRQLYGLDPMANVELTDSANLSTVNVSLITACLMFNILILSNIVGISRLLETTTTTDRRSRRQ